MCRAQENHCILSGPCLYNYLCCCLSHLWHWMATVHPLTLNLGFISSEEPPRSQGRASCFYSGLPQHPDLQEHWPNGSDIFSASVSPALAREFLQGHGCTVFIGYILLLGPPNPSFFLLNWKLFESRIHCSCNSNIVLHYEKETLCYLGGISYSAPFTSFLLFKLLDSHVTLRQWLFW